MPNLHDHAALSMKAKAFINRSFASSDVDDFEHAALLAAVALELLGKAALCKLSPLLIADPMDDGNSLLIAAGVSGDSSRFKTIPAKAVFRRCERAFPPFSAKDASIIALQRNAELHSGASSFSEFDDHDVWWERFWAQAVLLIPAQDQTVDDFVGTNRVAIVEAHLERTGRISLDVW